MSKSYGSADIKNLDQSQIEITVSIPSEIWEKHRAQAVKNLNETISVDGFRKGMIPENILVSKVGQGVINEEMAELAISRAYVDVIFENKIDAIGKPQVRVTKIALGNPLEFKAITEVVPKINLPDYKSLAQSEISKSAGEKVEVAEKEVDEAILNVRKSKVSHEGHNHSKMSPEEHEKAVLDSLPEFNDEFVASLSGEFKTVEEFKEYVRNMIGEDKKTAAKEKLRLKIADAILEKTSAVIPNLMVESELNRTEAQFNVDIERIGVKLDEYLKHSKKSLEDIRKEWRPHAEKKAKLQLILNSIAHAENLRPTPEEIEKEVAHIVDHYKDANREQAATYAETVLTNEKVFQFLENISK